MHFVGFLHKEVAEEYGMIVAILSEARAVVAATNSDIRPLLYVESGYVGCPVIANRKFAIPEIVEDRRTGLLSEEASARALATAMQWVLEPTNGYQEMRCAARKKMRVEHSRTKFEQRLHAYVSALASEQEVEGRAPKSGKAK